MPLGSEGTPQETRTEVEVTSESRKSVGSSGSKARGNKRKGE